MYRIHAIFFIMLGLVLAYLLSFPTSQTARTDTNLPQKNVDQKQIFPLKAPESNTDRVTKKQTITLSKEPKIALKSDGFAEAKTALKPDDFTEECLEQTGHMVIADSLFAMPGEVSTANEYAQFGAHDLRQLAENGDITAQIIYSMEHANPSEADA